MGQSTTLELTPLFHLTDNTYLTEEIPFSAAGENPEFIGLSCYHEDQNERWIEYRVKTADEWSAWKKFDLQHEFVSPDRQAYQTDLIEQSFAHVQFRTTTPLLSPITIRFFMAGRNRERVEIPVQSRVLDCEMPPYCSRTCWCPVCPIDNTPEFTDPTHLIVHHSAGSNQSTNFAAVVEYIWDLHVNTNGWDDIGYNWLVDPNGVIYEGRPDGYQGAHFSCLNENTVGICVIGNYMLVPPSLPAINALTDLLAFEATDHGIDILGQSYHLTGDFILDNLAGHRDSAGSEHACSSTACPGDSFYPMLGDIRTAISELPCYGNMSSSTMDVDREIKVFPNPVGEELYVRATDRMSLDLLTIYGEKVATLISGQVNDLSNLTPGIYFLLSEGKFAGKVVKQ